MLSPSNSPLPLAVLALISYKLITLISIAFNPSQVCKLLNSSWICWSASYSSELMHTWCVWVHLLNQFKFYKLWFKYTVGRKLEKNYFPPFLHVKRMISLILHIAPNHIWLCVYDHYMCVGILPLSTITLPLESELWRR